MKIFIVIFCLIFFTSNIFSHSSYYSSYFLVNFHSGRTDSKGGHYDRKTGLYHYHNNGTNSSDTNSNNAQTTLIVVVIILWGLNQLFTKNNKIQKYYYKSLYKKYQNFLKFKF